MKKINLKGISEVLSEKELKNVMGGSGEPTGYCNGGEKLYTISCGGYSGNVCAKSESDARSKVSDFCKW